MCKKLLILTSFVLVFGLVSSAIGQPTGEILFEYWLDIGGTAISDLTGQATYPDSPDDGEMRTAFEGKVDWADNYGQRVRGYLYPPEDGDYTFWVSGDDYCDLYLSTDDDPANAVLLAQVPGWTGYLAWNNYPEQQSAPVTLAAGGKYYIEGIMKEGGGGDSFTAAWSGPGIGEEITVIDGAYLSPAEPSPSLMKAKNPVPADGAVDADVALLEWAAGYAAVSHIVYLDGVLLAETDMTLAAASLDPGMTYTWQVNEVQEDGTVIEGSVWSFTTLPMEAHFPNPEDGAEEIESATLTWTVGKNTIINDVYFGTDADLVAAGDPSTFKGKLMVASYDPGPLELFTTYYWKVDEFTPTGTVPGPVWSFSTPKEVIIDSGSQTLNYDNSAEPYVSEVAFDVPADMTAEGVVSDLTLSFQGQGGNLSIDEATGTYQITGEGTDIWGGTDEFHYVYMNLTGDGEISARVVSNGTGSNAWAKGGVMIRETTDGNSKHMIMGLTGGEGGGIAFQGRAETGGNSSGFHGDVTAAPPTWVKLTRVGNDITGYYSADGVEWTQFTDASPDAGAFAITNPQPVEMADPVLIGLFVTSHANGENRTYTFDNVDIQGDVDGVIVSEDIDSVSGNSAEPIYVALEDSTGAVDMVTYPFPGATQIVASRFWRIPLSEFDVDPTAAAKLYVGVGDGEPGGAGAITISNIRVVKADVTAGVDSWEAAAAADSPGFIATNIADGVYDIGQYSGDMTYEFVVKSNPDETEASMALIGRRNFGDPTAGLKYEQWNNTGTYGATIFGVVDLDFGVATNPGVDTHLVFVSSEDLGTIELYVDGALAGSVDNSITLSGIVGIGYGAQAEDGSDSFDNFDGDIYGVAIYDAALSADQIAAHADAFFSPVSDITVPGDIVKGVPDDGDWPGGEPPAYAIDDNTGTKYLHFKGETEPTGIQITPLGGLSIVTGLSLTTANDAAERDPVSFELYGSNDSIDGPYELIADGNVVDFAGEAAWPRFTKNATPILFDNDVAYAHYQIMFPAVRDPGSANSMQIAEIELLGRAAPAGAPTIAWVSYHAADDEPHADAAAFGFTQAPDIEYTDLLKAQGYNVVRVLTSGTPDVEYLNTMDLVIISRTASSGHYGGSGATAWNSITAPMINLNGYTLRSSRMGFTDGTDMPDTTGDIRLAVTDPTHPIFAGIDLVDGTMVNLYAEGAVPLTTDETILSRGISINNNNIDDEGTLLATIAEVSADTGPVGGMVIAEYPAGATMQNSSGSPDDVLGGPRLVFLTGSREPDGVTGGQAAALYDLYEDGTQMFLNAVEYMLP